MNTKVWRGYRAAVATVVAFALMSAPAFAAKSIDPEQAAKHVGGILTSWATWGFSGVAAVLGIVLLASRKSGELIRFGAMCLVVGGLVFATSTVIAIIRGLWGAL